MEKILDIRHDGGRRFSSVLADNGLVVASDQSPENGGEGVAPEPFQLFLAGMATCAAVYLQGYAEKKGLVIDWSQTQVQLHGHWDPKARVYEKLCFSIGSKTAFNHETQQLLEKAIRRSAVLRQINHVTTYEVEFHTK
jgi:putative redox protein